MPSPSNPVEHVWIARCLCPECGQYSWTNPGASTVRCKCGFSLIADNVVMSGDPVTDETAFHSAVAADIGVAEDDLDLVRG